jgi:hypothetical protein
MNSRYAILFLSLVGIGRCDFADDERCPAGFTYIPEQTVCKKNQKLDGGKVDGSAASDGVLHQDGLADGASSSLLGKPCAAQTECKGPEVDYCTLNPLNPGAQGVCTQKCSSTVKCPKQWTCCDCVIEVFCLADKDVASATSNGCTCK